MKSHCCDLHAKCLPRINRAAKRVITAVMKKFGNDQRTMSTRARRELTHQLQVIMDRAFKLGWLPKPVFVRILVDVGAGVDPEVALEIVR